MTDEMTDERLAEIRGRAEEATPAPWVRCSTDFREHRSHSAKTVASGMVIAFAGYGPDGGTVWCDAEFIAHARQDVPDLLVEVERLRARNADLSLRLDEVTHELEEHVAPERDRLREQIERLRAENADLHAKFARYWSEVPRRWIEGGAAEAKACGVTGLDPCPWHPDGGNHPTSAR